MVYYIANMSVKKLWDDVVIMTRMYGKMPKSIGLNPVMYALQDYCKASGKDLAVMDPKFDHAEWGNFACFFKGNTHYLVDMPRVAEVMKQAVYSTDYIMIVPVVMGTNQRSVGSVEPDLVYDTPDQCRGFNLSLLDRK